MQSVKGVLSGKSAERHPVGRSGLRVRRPRRQQPDFLPVGLAADSLGVSPMTVRRLFDARKLPGYRQGRNRQILRVFVEGFRAEVDAGRQPVLQEYADAWFKQAEAVTRRAEAVA